MTKQAKMKKGSIGKKALAAILTASMVLSSSAFTVFATSADKFPAEDTSNYVKLKAEGAQLVAGKNDEFYYSGTEIKPTIDEIYVSGTKYTKPYKVESYSGEFTNVSDSNALPKVRINFTDSTYAQYDKEYKIVQLPVDDTIAKGTIFIPANSEKEFVYDGTKKEPKVSSVVIKNIQLDKEVPVSSDDYEITATPSNLIDAGEKELSVALKNNLTGSAMKIAAEGDEESGATTYKYNIAQKPVEKGDFYLTGNKVVVSNVENGLNSIKVFDNADDELLDKGDYGTGDYEIKFIQDDNTYGAASTAKDDVGYYTNGIEISFNKMNFDGSHSDNNKKCSNYEGTIYADYEVIKSDTLADVVANQNTLLSGYKKNKDGSYSREYDKDNTTAPEIATIGDLTKDDDYSVETDSGNWTDVGEYEITITGKKTYYGEVVKIIAKITPQSITDNSNINISAEQGTLSDQKTKGSVVVTVDDDGTVLEENKDYTTSVSSDSKKVTITGIGNYKDNKSDTISPKTNLSLKDKAIEAKIEKVYDWKSSGVKVDIDDVIVTETLPSGKKTLISSSEYRFDTSYAGFTGGYKDNDRAGKAYVAIMGLEPYYKDSIPVEFTIKGFNTADELVAEPLGELDLPDTGSLTVDASGKKIGTTAIKIKYVSGGTYTDWTFVKVLDANGKDVGTTISKTGSYTAIVTPGKQYEGDIEIPFEVVGSDITKSIYVEVADGSKYTGKEVEPNVVVKTYGTDGKPETTDDQVLIEGTDYELTYDGNIEAGPAYAVVKLIGKYSGTKTEVFYIDKVDGTVTLDADQKGELENGVAAGSTMALKLVPSITDESVSCSVSSSDEDVVSATGKTLTFGKAGTAEITITPTSRNLNITSEPIKVTVKVTNEAPSKTTTVSFTPSRNVYKVARYFTVTSNTVKGATGWKVKYSLKKSMKSSKTKTFGASNRIYRKRIKANKSGKRYYIQVAAKVNGKWVWSKQKSVVSR